MTVQLGVQPCRMVHKRKVRLCTAFVSLFNSSTQIAQPVWGGRPQKTIRSFQRFWLMFSTPSVTRLNALTSTFIVCLGVEEKPTAHQNLAGYSWPVVFLLLREIVNHMMMTPFSWAPKAGTFTGSLVALICMKTKPPSYNINYCQRRIYSIVWW